MCVCVSAWGRARARVGVYACEGVHMSVCTFVSGFLCQVSHSSRTEDTAEQTMGRSHR